MGPISKEINPYVFPLVLFNLVSTLNKYRITLICSPIRRLFVRPKRKYCHSRRGNSSYRSNAMAIGRENRNPPKAGILRQINLAGETKIMKIRKKKLYPKKQKKRKLNRSGNHFTLFIEKKFVSSWIKNLLIYLSNCRSLRPLPLPFLFHKTKKKVFWLSIFFQKAIISLSLGFRSLISFFFLIPNTIDTNSTFTRPV